MGRRDRYSSSTGFVILINHKGKSKLVQVEPQTSILIADEDVDRENPKVRGLPIWQSVRAQRVRWGGTAHLGTIFATRGPITPSSCSPAVPSTV